MSRPAAQLPLLTALFMVLTSCTPAHRAPEIRLPWADFDLKVMSFNLRYASADDGANGWKHRRDIVMEVLERRRPDVVGLQEALLRQLTAVQHGLEHYAWVGAGRLDGREAGEHCAILYRSDRFEALDHGTFWLSATPEIAGSTTWGNDIPRICTWARLAQRGGARTVMIYNVHLDHVSQASREQSVELLIQRIASRDHGDPVIVTGDFNAGEQNAAIEALRAAGFIDTYRRRHPQADKVGTYHGFDGGHDGAKIDYVLVQPSLTILDAAILYDNVEGRYPSDHFPVEAKVRW